MKTFYFPIQSTSLAHYLGAAIIKPAKYFVNKPHDLQDNYEDFLLLTTNVGTSETDCCLDIILTYDEEKELIDVHDGWFLYDVSPLPISRIRKILFADKEKRDTTITNIRMSTAYVPESLVEICEFAYNPSANIHVPDNCCGVEKNKEIMKYDRFLGALALMKTAGEPYMNYSPNYISTLSFFNSVIEEQLYKIKNFEIKKSFQGLFDNSKGFEYVLPYLDSKIDEQTLYKIAEENKQVIKKDKITRIIDINSFTDTWTYTIAILSTYGVGEEVRRKRIDGLIQSHFASIKKGKAEGVALCYGYNRGYSAFAKDYIIDENGERVSYKYKLESKLDYYTIESVFQYVFNDVVSSSFPYLDNWCPKLAICKPIRRNDYVVLDELVIGKRNPKVFSEEWWNGLLPKFNEFGRLANVLSLFFKEICREMQEDIKEEQEEIVTLYEKRIDEYNKRIVDLTKKLNQQNEALNLPQQKTAYTNNTDNQSLEKRCVDFSKLKLSDLREMARKNGISIPSKAKKDEIIKLLKTIEATPKDLFYQSNN